MLEKVRVIPVNNRIANVAVCRLLLVSSRTSVAADLTPRSNRRIRRIRKNLANCRVGMSGTEDIKSIQPQVMRYFLLSLARRSRSRKSIKKIPQTAVSAQRNIDSMSAGNCIEIESAKVATVMTEASSMTNCQSNGGCRSSTSPFVPWELPGNRTKRTRKGEPRMDTN
jgi:hypothetical protein